MTHQDIIDELGKISKGVTAGNPSPDPDPFRRLVETVMAIEDLRGKLIQELRDLADAATCAVTPSVWAEFYPPVPPAEAGGSWRTRPPLL